MSGRGVPLMERPPASADVVVVGGGVVGAATAFYAVRAGLSVVLVERRPALATLTTAASTGAFRLQFDNLEELQLVRRSVDLFENFTEVTRQDAYDLGLRPAGYLWCTTDPARVARQQQLVGRQHGWGLADVEWLDGDAARARFPHLSAAVVGARFRPGDGFLDPRALTMGLAAGGPVPVLAGTAVTGVQVTGGRAVGVETTRGEISAGAVVVAAGPFSAPLLATVGVALPVVTVPRHKVVLPDVAEVPADAPMTIDEETGAHWRPALRGAYLLHTDPATEPTPPTEAVPPDARFAFRLLDPASPVAVARISPFWTQVWQRNVAPWFVQSGQYVVTPDHRPLIGPVGPDGLHVNTGYSGHGVMGSPAGSALLADLLTETLAAADNPFAVEREFRPRDRDVL